VDYAIFLREGARHAESAPPSSRLSVWLAAATSLLSFGGLSLSATPFLRDIGLTLTVGIALAFLLSLLLAPRRSAP
jgi:predicted exporter